MGIIKKKEKKLKYQSKRIASGYEGINFYAVWDKKNPDAVGIMLSGEHILSKKLPDRIICEIEEVHKDFFVKHSCLFVPTNASQYDIFKTTNGEKIFSGVEITQCKDKNPIVILKDPKNKRYAWLDTVDTVNRGYPSKLHYINNVEGYDRDYDDRYSDFKYEKIENIPGYDNLYIASKGGKQGLIGHTDYGLFTMLNFEKGTLQCITKSNMLISREKGCVEGYKIYRFNSVPFQGKDKAFRGEKLEWQDEIEIGRLKNIGTGKWGLINLYNPPEKYYDEIDFKYDSIEEFKNIDVYHWIAKAKLKGKYGYINTDGTEYIPCIFDEISDFDEKKTAKAKFNGEEVVLEKNKIIVSPKFLSTHKISPSKNVEVLCKNDFEEIKDI